MKWKNKGHEFDEVYNRLAEKKRFWLFGAGTYGRAMLEELGKLGAGVLGFLDNDESLRHTKRMGKEIAALDEVSLKEDEAVIVCVSPVSRRPVEEQLARAGYADGKDAFTMEAYMSLKYAYELGKAYVPSVSFLPSTRCNLNCEACLNFTPYLERQMVRPLEEVKEDVDVFFHAVDYVMLFHISGGEPFLYPHLKELVTYIGENYRDRMHFLQTVTNGTVELGDDVLEALARYRAGVTVDDYREAVPEKSGAFSRAVEKLRKHGVRYEVNKAERWIDLAPTRTDHGGWDEERLMRYFEACHEPWQELRDGRLYSCNYASYAAVAGLAEEREDEWFDLRGFDKGRVKELMEFRMGYNEKGYVEFCKRCAGFMDINQNIVEPARQKGR